MIKLVFLLRYPDGVPVEEGEKWYLGTHTQEAKKMRPLVKYVTHRVLDVPGQPTPWLRLTELWFDFDSPEDHRRLRASSEYPKFTPAPYGPNGFETEVMCVNVEPQYDFLREKPPVARQDDVIKMVYFLRYPDGVSLEEGEKWYLGTHTQEAKHIPGLANYVSYNAIPIPGRPAHWGPERWARLTELSYSYKTPEDLVKARSLPDYPKYTSPKYGPRGFIAETVCVNVEPEYDLLK